MGKDSLLGTGEFPLWAKTSYWAWGEFPLWAKTHYWARGSSRYGQRLTTGHGPGRQLISWCSLAERMLLLTTTTTPVSGGRPGGGAGSGPEVRPRSARWMNTLCCLPHCQVNCGPERRELRGVGGGHSGLNGYPLPNGRSERKQERQHSMAVSSLRGKKEVNFNLRT